MLSINLQNFRGERGIRTLGATFAAHTLSRRAPSATRTPLLLFYLLTGH
jgi:hypothetical protein